MVKKKTIIGAMDAAIAKENPKDLQNVIDAEGAYENIRVNDPDFKDGMTSNDIVDLKDADGNTPMHKVAAALNAGSLVDVLLPSNPELDVKNNKGQTPLDVAIDHNNKVVIAKIEEHEKQKGKKLAEIQKKQISKEIAPVKDKSTKKGNGRL